MTDELKQWEYDKGYEKGKADMLKVIEAEIDNRMSNLENVDMRIAMRSVKGIINDLSPVNPQKPKTGHCKDCKYFEYDSVARVDGMLLIVAHEICSKWGDGCKTREDGYCFLFEPRK